jgi:prepilin-type processing-associated H-X9-DG protein
MVGLISALAVPALKKAQEYGERGRDISNLRQIGTALLAHAGDHQNTFPAAAGRMGWGQTSPITGLPSWTEQISPYLSGNTNVFFSRRALLPDPPGSPSPGYFLGTRPVMAAERRFGPVHLSRLQAPSQTILGGLVAAPGLFQTDDWDKDDYTQSPAFGPDKKSRLPGPVPILFADGHVRECPFFDTNSMTTEYEKGRWYGF